MQGELYGSPTGLVGGWDGDELKVGSRLNTVSSALFSVSTITHGISERKCGQWHEFRADGAIYRSSMAQRRKDNTMRSFV